MPTCHHATTCSKHAQGSCQSLLKTKNNSRFQEKENEGTLKETKFPQNHAIRGPNKSANQILLLCSRKHFGLFLVFALFHSIFFAFSPLKRFRGTSLLLLELRIQKKSEKRPQKWARNSNPFLVPILHFPRAQKTVAFRSLHFGAGEPLSSLFLCYSLCVVSFYFLRFRHLHPDFAC